MFFVIKDEFVVGNFAYYTIIQYGYDKKTKLF